ncbi:MAG: porin family protein, partial [Bacteroides sp.]
MKKSLSLVLVLLLGFSMAAQAQVKFGIKGGLNVTDVSFSNLS